MSKTQIMQLMHNKLNTASMLHTLTEFTLLECCYGNLDTKHCFLNGHEFGWDYT